jgi:hypothetical protein
MFAAGEAAEENKGGKRLRRTKRIDAARHLF